MDIRVDAIQMSTNVPECMSVQQIQKATEQDEHLQWLKGYIIAGWTESKDQLHQDIRAYWSFRDDMAVIDDQRTKKIMSDSGSNFISDKFKTLCKSLNIEHFVII